MLSAVLPVYTQTGIPGRNGTADRRTALEFLDSAGQYIAEGQWNSALTQAELGLVYAPDIPDLLYVKALALSGMGRPPAEVISAVAAAVGFPSWNRYNRDAGRILLADLLSDTCEPEQAVAILDASPAVSSADAWFIRAKSLYRTGNPSQARTAVKTARAMFPYDSRFAELFFRQEAGLPFSDDARSLADDFIRVLPYVSMEDPDVTLYALPFVTDGDDRIRLLQSYRVAGNRHSLSPVYALRDGLVSEAAAFEEIQTYAASGMDFSVFREFALLLSDDETRKEVGAWLDSYDGLFFWDVNGDGITDLTVQYESGRPSSVVFDDNQDGVETFSALCDTGVPYEVRLNTGDGENLTVSYGVFPAVSRVRSGEDDSPVLYDMVPGRLLWTPVDMEAVSIPVLEDPFYVPIVRQGPLRLDETALAFSAYSIEKPSAERSGARIRFNMLDGVPVSAVSSVNGMPYAYTVFEEGIPIFRNVDTENDGFYEVTEKYGYDSEKTGAYDTGENTAVLNLYGPDVTGKGIYLSGIAADMDRDGYPEYMEELLPYGGRRISWDIDADGIWDIRYIKYGQNSGAVMEEEVQYRRPVTGELVSVFCTDGIPRRVETSSGSREIRRDVSENLYWIGKTPGEAMPGASGEQAAKKLLEKYNLEGRPDVSFLTEIDGVRILLVYAGGLYFGEIIDEA